VKGSGKMKKKRIVSMILGISFFLVSRVDALTYLGASHSGDPVPGIGARSLGMGGTSIASAIDSSSVFINPSCLGTLDRKELSLTVGIAPIVEKIVTEDELTYFNSQCYFEINSIVMAFPVKRKLVLALGLAPLYNNKYLHEKTLFDPVSPGEELGSASIQAKGALYSYCCGGAWKLSPYLYIGGSINLLQGKTIFENSSIVYVSPPAAITALESRIAGFNFNLGGILCFTDEFRAGFSVRTRGKLKEKWKVERRNSTTEGERDLKSPLTFGFGLAYTCLDEYNSIISAEFMFNQWSGFKTGTNYSDTLEFRVGAEHYLADGLCLRYGFYLQPFYGSKQFQIVSFTAGLGYKFNHILSLDLAGEFGKRNYYGDAAFFEERQRIDETLTRILVAVRIQP